MSEHQSFPTHLGGEFKGVDEKDLPETMLPRASVGSVVKARHYLEEIVDPRLKSAEAAGNTQRINELREVARTLKLIIGKSDATSLTVEHRHN